MYTTQNPNVARRALSKAVAIAAPFKKDDSTVPALLIPTLYDAIGDALLL